MLSVLVKLGAAAPQIFILIAQLVPLIAELKAQSGQPISDTEKQTLQSIALSSLSTIEGVTNSALLQSPKVQSLIASAIDVFVELHDLLSHPAPAAPPAQ